MINNAKQRYLFAPKGEVNSTDGSYKIGKGVFMFADAKKAKGDGLLPLDLSSIRKDDKRVRILVGEDETTKRLRSYVQGAAQTEPFSLEQVKAIKYKTPKNLESSVDSWVLGWTGRSDEPETSFKFRNNARPFRISMALEGGGIQFSGGSNFQQLVDFVYPFDNIPDNDCITIDECDYLPCGDITRDIVKSFRRHPLVGKKVVNDYVKVTPIISCANSSAAEKTDFVFYELTVCDAGTQAALADVRNQYPGVDVVRINRKGSSSTYQLMTSGSSPSAYTQDKIEVLPGCETCESGWTAKHANGHVYVFTTVDDKHTAVNGYFDTLYSSDTSKFEVKLIGNENGTDNFVYSVVVADEITPTDVTAIQALVTGFTYQYLGIASIVCEKTTTTTTSWTEGDTCQATVETYSIVLPDNECGNSRLKELQAFYPDLQIGESQMITLTGTGGTATVTVGSDTYTATFATDLETTATNFVSTNETAIEANGNSVYSNGETITIITRNGEAVSIANDTSDLDGDATDSKEACQRRYVATVNTNLVCDECDTVFEDLFSSESPEVYDGEDWALTGAAEQGLGSSGCLCGIKITARPFKMNPADCKVYDFPYIESSPTIEVDAGYTDFTTFDLASRGFVEPEHKRRLSTKKDRDMLAGDMLRKWRHSAMYSHGRTVGESMMSDDFRGLSFPFSDLGAQMSQFSIEILHNRDQHGFSSPFGKTTNVNIFVEMAYDSDIVSAINDLAAASGKQIVYE